MFHPEHLGAIFASLGEIVKPIYGKEYASSFGRLVFQETGHSPGAVKLWEESVDTRQGLDAPNQKLALKYWRAQRLEGTIFDQIDTIFYCKVL